MFPLKIGEILPDYTASHIDRDVLLGSTKVGEYV
jgi:hypothetical protein